MSAIFGPAGNSKIFYEQGYKRTEEAFKWLSDMGLDAFEYPAGNGITASLSTFEALGRKAAVNSIKTSFHAPYYISLSGVEEEKREKSVDYIEKSHACAKALGAGIIVIHTGSAAKISRETAVSYAKHTMAKALERIPDEGIKFGLETMGKQNQLGTLGEVLDICSVDKRLCPVVDFGHMNARNAGSLFRTRDDYRRVFEQIDHALGAEYALRLHCHFSKIEYTQAGEKRHLTFEDNIFGPDFEPLIEVIAQDSLSPTVICESDGTMAQDALTMKKYYLSLTASGMN